jgi:membrane associated rhomboid family serine protease
MAFIPIYDTNPLRNIRRPWVAWGLIVANIVVYFLVESGTAGEASDASVIAFGLFPGVFSGLDVSRSALPDVLTLVTYSFLHADFWHLAGNMVFLWVLADNVEDALGHWRFLLFYLLCAAGAGYIFVLANSQETNPVIGASGAIAGTISAYLILHPKAKMWVLAFGRIPLRLSAVYVLSFWIVFQFFAAFSGSQGKIAWWSHIGGLVCGAVFVLVMRRKNTPLFDRAVDDPAAPPIGSPPTQEPRKPWG